MNTQAAPDPASSRTLTLLDIASLLVVLALAATAYGAWRYGPPGLLPVHFGLDGLPNRMGSRSDLALGLAINALVAALVAGLCGWFEHDPKTAAQVAHGGRFTFRFGRMIGLLAPSFATVLMVSAAFGWLPHDADGKTQTIRWSAIGISALMLIIGAFIGKARQNPFVGVRTYWSLTSRLAWDKSNRLAGRLLALIGLAGLILSPFAPMPQGMIAITSAIIAAALAAVIESYRVWRIDPERGQRA
jgi:hypothetical protein